MDGGDEKEEGEEEAGAVPESVLAVTRGSEAATSAQAPLSGLSFFFYYFISCSLSILCMFRSPSN